MDVALKWWGARNQANKRDRASKAGVAARYGGDDRDEPVLAGTIAGLIEIEMAQDALQEAGIPAYFRRNSLGPVYGLSVGSFGSAEVWVVPPLVERTRDVLIGIGLLDTTDQY